VYLLDTQAFLDFLEGNPADAESSAAMRFVAEAEEARRRVSVSVVSIGMIRWAVEQLKPGPQRHNLERRLNMAVHTLELGGQIYELDRDAVEAWVQLRAVELFDADGAVMGDDERMVAATALAKSLTLVTRWPQIYQPAADYGLAVRPV